MSKRISRAREADCDAMTAAFAEFLRAAGFDPEVEPHLERTAQRVAEAWSRDLLGGYDVDPIAALGSTFPAEHNDRVVVRDIEFFSSCPHHLLPYRGTARLAYVPDKLGVGFSGLVRLVDALAHRLTLQEWLARDIVGVLNDVLAPKGAGCVIEATPMCVLVQGVKRPCSIETAAWSGCFEDDPSLRTTTFGSSRNE